MELLRHVLQLQLLLGAELQPYTTPAPLPPPPSPAATCFVRTLCPPPEKQKAPQGVSSGGVGAPTSVSCRV